MLWAVETTFSSVLLALDRFHPRGSQVPGRDSDHRPPDARLGRDAVVGIAAQLATAFR
jgi:hypothetical protein